MSWLLPTPLLFIAGVLALVPLAYLLCWPAPRLPWSSSGAHVTFALRLQAVRIILDELQLKGERRPTAGSRLHRQLTVMQLHQPPRYVQPQSDTGHPLSPLVTSPLKLLEDASLSMGWDTGTAVSYLDPNPSPLRSGTQLDWGTNG